MKRIISLIAAIMLVCVMLTGCESDGSASSDTSAVSSENGQTMTGDGAKSPSAYNKDFEGFVQYMKDNGFISGDGADLTAAAIGASKGQRFTISSPVSKHTVELYEYTDQTSDIAVKTITDARTDGSFHLFESTEYATQYTLAAVSEDGRFLMLYTDSSESGSKAEQKQAAAEAVYKFSK